MRKTQDVLVGALMLVAGLVVFVAATLSMILSKLYKDELLASCSSPLMKFLIRDSHYCLLPPVLLNVTLLLAYVRWSYFAYFKHC